MDVSTKCVDIEQASDIDQVGMYVVLLLGHRPVLTWPLVHKHSKTRGSGRSCKINNIKKEIKEASVNRAGEESADAVGEACAWCYVSVATDIHYLTNLFETTAAFFHVGTLTLALTRIVHPRRRALLGWQRAAPARHVLHDGVRRTRLLIGLRVVYSYL